MRKQYDFSKGERGKYAGKVDTKRAAQDVREDHQEFMKQLQVALGLPLDDGKVWFGAGLLARAKMLAEAKAGEDAMREQLRKELNDTQRERSMKRNERDALFSQEFAQWATGQKWWSDPYYMEVAWGSWQAALASAAERERELREALQGTMRWIQELGESGDAGWFDGKDVPEYREAERVLSGDASATKESR